MLVLFYFSVFRFDGSPIYKHEILRFVAGLSLYS